MLQLLSRGSVLAVSSSILLTACGTASGPSAEGGKGEGKQELLLVS